MNYCHNSYSCIACCGLFNLKIPEEDHISLLLERTQDFQRLEKKEHSTFLTYRNRREKKESRIPRHRPDVYVCPFQGIINGSTPGCMIHPQLTGDSKSQDASFYGSSLCQEYDCHVKQYDTGHVFYKAIILFLGSSYFQKYLHDKYGMSSVTGYRELLFHLYYSRLIADYVFFLFCRKYIDFRKVFTDSKVQEVFFDLCFERLLYTRNVTSFEINYHRFDVFDFEKDFSLVFFQSQRKAEYDMLLKNAN